MTTRRWPVEHVLNADLLLPDGVTLSQASRAEIPELCQALALCHPDIAIGEEQHLLSRAFYEDEAALRGEEDAIDERPVYPLLLRGEGRILGAAVLEAMGDHHALFGRITAVAPSARGRGLGRALLRADALVGRAVGADMVFGLAELDNLPQCAALESEGQIPCAIIPDSERRQVAPGVVRYVPEALYVKLLAPSEALLWPGPDAMTPQVAALLRVLDLPGASAPDAPFVAPRPATPPIELDPQVAARLRLRPGGASTWPDAAECGAQLRLPDGFTLSTLRRADVPAVVSLLPAWFPEVAQGSQAHYLDPAFYERSVALVDRERAVSERRSFAWLIRDHEEIVAFGCCSYDVHGLTVRADLGVMDPRRRRSGLGAAHMPFVVLLARAIEAETIMGWASTRNAGAQIAAERAGWQLWGLIPASERYATPRGVGLGAEALYGVSLVPPAQARWPDLAKLPPHRAALVRQLFGDPSGGGR